ncbi:hypothetical protein J6TS2_38180 [Heyndrickxia sporothermodurans]|nr:hypothetical protein J6TS2_38180 [Heyndrickxia sporothermodurans]
MVARVRQKMTLSTVLGLGRIVTKRLDKVISPSLSDENVLCTDLKVHGLFLKCYCRHSEKQFHKKQIDIFFR